MNDCRMEPDGVRFRLGDMVWAKVKSHPWWPGQIFDPALASSLARKSRRESHVLVAFFGDSTFGWFPESELLPFEPDFADRSKQTSAPNFVEAVEDALEEIGRRVELGLICPCSVSVEMEERRQKGRGLNLDRQLREARKAFKPSKMVAFVKDLACTPFAPARDLLWRAKAEAQAHAFRVTAFCARNSENEEYFGNVSEDGDPTQNNKAGKQGLNNYNVKMGVHRVSLPEGGDSEGAVDMDREPKLVPEDFRKKEKVVRLDKFSEKMKVDVTSSVPSGTGKSKRSRMEKKTRELPESTSPGMKGRKCLKDAIPNRGVTEGESGGLRSNKASSDYSQDTITETFRNDAHVSDINGGECPKLQPTPKKSTGFKRLVKGLKSVRAESKEPLSVDRSVNNKFNGLGNLEPREIRMDSNKRKREKKSTLHSKRDFDSGRPSKRKVRPSMTPGTCVSDPYMTAVAADVPDDKKNLVGGFEEQRIANVVSLGRETADTSFPVPSESMSDAGLLLQEENLCEKHEGNNSLGNLPALSDIHEGRGKNCESEKGFSQKEHPDDMETVHVDKEETCKFKGSRSPFGEGGPNLMVSGDKGGLQFVEVCGQTQREVCAPSNAVVKDTELEKKIHEVKMLKSYASKNGNLSRTRDIVDLDCTQKSSEPKRKRLKTLSSEKASEHLTRDVNGGAVVCVHTSLKFKKKSESRSEDLVSAEVDSMFEQQTAAVEKPQNIEVNELFDHLTTLAANPLGESKEQLFFSVQKAFTNFRKAVLQSDHGFHPTRSQQGQNSVSASSTASVLRVCQESEQITNVTQICGDDLNAMNRDEQGGAITETSEQFSEAETSNANIVKPEISRLQEVKLECLKQAKAEIGGQCCQAKASEADNLRPENGRLEVQADCQRGISERSFDGLVKNLKKPALTSVSRKVSVSSSRPVLEADIPVHGLRDASKSFDSVNQHGSKFGTEADKILHPSKVNRASQAQGTALLMKFPQGFALPSEAQLRATFVHFGQLDLSGTRIYHNSGCAQIVYRHVHDAEVALKYVKENRVFGQAPVSFRLRQFSQTREVGVAQISLSSKESKSLKNEERLILSSVDKEDINIVHDKGTLMSRGNGTVYDNHLQTQSRSPWPLKSCLKKTDDPMSSTAKNGARVTFQLSCGVNLQSMSSTNASQNTSVMDQVVVKSNCEKLSGIPNDPHSHVGSSPSLQYSCSGPGPPSFSLPISTDISHQMLTLLHQVSALVGSSGIVL